MIEGFLELSSKGSNNLILDFALLIKINFTKKKGRTIRPNRKAGKTPSPSLFKILALHMVFVSI